MSCRRNKGLILSLSIFAIFYMDGTFTVASSVELEIDLNQGWNLISIPVKLPDNAIGVALQSIPYSSVWTYDTANSEWQTYIVGGPAFLNTLDTIKARKGYWILMTYPAVLTLEGTIADDLIPLKPGWNLVGYNCLTTKPLAEALSSVAGKYSSVWTYDSASGEWRRYAVGAPESLNDLQRMEPGKAYWIDAKVSCKWNVSGRGYRGYVTFTFDDNCFSHYTVAYQYMKRYGYPGVVNIIPSYIGTGCHLSWEQLREMVDNGWSIGNHTYSHKHLSILTDEQIHDEIYGAVLSIAENLDGYRCVCFCAPYGDMPSSAIKEALLYHDVYMVGTGLNAVQEGRFSGKKVTRWCAAGTMSDCLPEACRENKWLVLRFHGLWTLEQQKGFRNVVDMVHDSRAKVVLPRDLIPAR